MIGLDFIYRNGLKLQPRGTNSNSNGLLGSNKDNSNLIHFQTRSIESKSQPITHASSQTVLVKFINNSNNPISGKYPTELILKYNPQHSTNKFIDNPRLN